MATESQTLRQQSRRRNGQYERNICDNCGKSAPMDYSSEGRTGCTIEGVDISCHLLCLCNRCGIKLGKMSDHELAVHVAIKTGQPVPSEVA